MPTTITCAAWSGYISGAEKGTKKHWHTSIGAIELDPDFASAYGMAARCYAQRKSCSWASEPEKEAVEAARLARKATDLGRDDAVALYSAAVTWAYVVGRLDDGIDCIERALALNPNLAWAWVTGGWMYVFLGRPEE